MSIPGRSARSSARVASGRTADAVNGYLEEGRFNTMLTFFHGVIGKATHKKLRALANTYFYHDRSGINPMNGAAKGFSDHTY